MNKAELVAQQLLGGNLNKVQWGSAMYNALVEGLAGGGVVDDTAKLQVLVDKAIAEGRKAIFFPHGTNGQYRVTALTNANQVVFFGDNASFVGGYSGTINQLGQVGDVTPDYYNVLDNGLVGDGVANDTTALQALINVAIAAGKKSIFFPRTTSGQYYVTALTNADQVVFFGDNATFVGGYTGEILQLGEGGVTQAEFDALKADLAISPDSFTGTDFQKVQAAIDYAIANNKAVRFARLYDITGSGPFIIDKPDDRKMLYLIGAGGGIKKTDSGYIFSSTNAYIGDIASYGMKYESVPGNGTIVWNGNKIIRIGSTLDSYRDVDTVLEAATTYSQSNRFIQCTITRGAGWAFEWKKSYDTTIKDCTIEHREHGIRNTVFTSNPDNDNLRIIDNVIEGLTGKAADLGSSFAVLIQGNYVEGNVGGYFDLSLSANFHNGLSIIANSCQQSADQITADTPLFKIDNIGSDGIFSAGNVTTGVLYNADTAGTLGRIVSVGDRSYNNKKIIGSPSLLSELGRITTLTDGRSYGRVAQYRFNSVSTSFAAGEVKDITIATTLTLVGTSTMQDTITAHIYNYSGSQQVVVHNITTSANNVVVRVENKSAGAQTMNVGVIIMRIES